MLSPGKCSFINARKYVARTAILCDQQNLWSKCNGKMDTLQHCTDTDAGRRHFLSKKKGKWVEVKVTQSFQSFGDPIFVFLREKP